MTETEKTGGLRQILVKVFCAGALLIFGWFFLSALFDLHARPYVWMPLSAVLTAGFCGVTALVRRKEITDRVFFRSCFGVAVILLALQGAAAYLLAVEPSWDFGGVYVSAYEYVVKGSIITHEHYFERFSNNTGLLLWEILCFQCLKKLGITSPVIYGMAGIAMNIAVIDLSILFTVLFARRMWGNAKALLVLGLCALFTPYVLYAPIFYTDSMSLIFVSLPLYLLAVYLDQKTPWKRAALAVSIGVLLSFGAKVKGNVAVLLVAFCLYAVFNFGWKQVLSFLLAVCLSFFGFSCAFDRQVLRMRIIKEENVEQINFPMEYWFYMGLRNPGGFNEEDFEELYALSSRTERQQAARDGIARRVREYGFSGMVDHLTQKSGFTFGDGTYFIGVQLMRQPLRETAVSPYFMSGTAEIEYYAAFADSYQAMLLLSLLAGLVLDLLRKKGFGMTTLLYVSLFGLSLFLMMWETRSRYVLNFTPIILVLTGNAIWELWELFSAKRDRKQREKTLD